MIDALSDVASRLLTNVWAIFRRLLGSAAGSRATNSPSKIVDCDADTDAAETLKHSGMFACRVHEHGSVSSSSRRRVASPSPRGPRDIGFELAWHPELQRRHIHAHLDRFDTGIAPCLGLRQRPTTPMTSLAMTPICSATRMNESGPITPRLGWRQRTNASTR